MKYRWELNQPSSGTVDLLERELEVSSLLSRCLANRGIIHPEEGARFLKPRLKDLADPFDIPNMDKLVERLWSARSQGESIVIFGDYDVDGITASAILHEVLTVLGWKTVHIYLPHRLEEGYGLSQSGVENCVARFRSDILFAVDCGSTAADTIAWLKKNGIGVLVLDHHQISQPAPEADVLVNPQLDQSGSAKFHELCSAGLAFKVAHALLKKGREAGIENAWSYDLKVMLDLVALGTVADLVPLTGENRIMVSKGLEVLTKTYRPGLKALKSIANITGDVGVFEIGFQLGPRLNAAGRMENAVDALELLLESDLESAHLVAQQLEMQNRERQRIERSIADEAVGAVKAEFNQDKDFIIVQGNLLWHIGVVGIVASRVMREFYRPTIIIGGEGEQWRGSGRSIQGFDLAAALRECDDLLVRHGGHAMAAGLSIEPENIDELRVRLNAIARREIPPEYLRPALRVDAEIPLDYMNLESLEELAQLQPLGQGNPKVQLVTRRVRHQRAPRRLGRDQQHAKMWVTSGSGSTEVIWWNCDQVPLPDGEFDIAYEPQINRYNGRESVLLKLLDWQPSHVNGH